MSWDIWVEDEVEDENEWDRDSLNYTHKGRRRGA